MLRGWYFHIAIYYIHIKIMHKDKIFFVMMHDFNVDVINYNVEYHFPYVDI